MPAKEKHPIDPQLIENLRVAKGELKLAQQKVLDAESAIYLATEKLLPEKGTTTFVEDVPDGEGAVELKIVTKVYEKWDQELLAKAEAEWAANKAINAPFPFKKEYKGDGKALTYIRTNVPDQWKILSPALTVTPAKPAFTFKDEKGGEE